jgi:hypothetical protein
MYFNEKDMITESKLSHTPLRDETATMVTIKLVRQSKK